MCFTFPPACGKPRVSCRRCCSLEHFLLSTPWNGFFHHGKYNLQHCCGSETAAAYRTVLAQSVVSSRSSPASGLSQRSQQRIQLGLAQRTPELGKVVRARQKVCSPLYGVLATVISCRLQVAVLALIFLHTFGMSGVNAGAMTRGNQREIDRQRAAKRAGGGKTLKDKDGLTPEQRKER